MRRYGRKSSGFDLIFAIVELLFDIADGDNSSIFSSWDTNEYDYKEYEKSKSYSIPKKTGMEDVKAYMNEPVFPGMQRKTSSSRENANLKSKVKQPVQKRKPITVKPRLTSKTANQLKLEILLLSYMFKEDDGKISFTEKREIKKHFTKYTKSLKNEDIADIKELLGLDNSLMNIRAVISQNDITDEVIESSFLSLKIITNNSYKYQPIIKRLKSAITESVGY